MAKNMESVSIGDGLKYPLNNFARMFNFYWILIPILGLLAVAGYGLTIMAELVKGKKDELPEWGSFGENLKQGFLVIVYSIPLIIIVGVLMSIPVIGWLLYVLAVLVLPMLGVNYAVKRKFAALYDFQWAFKVIFSDFGDYIVAVLKTIAFTIVYALGSILVVTMIVTIPAMQFGGNFYFADFYRRHQ